MPDELRIPRVEQPDDKRVMEAALAALAAGQATSSGEGSVGAVPPRLQKTIAAIATNAWRAKTRMVDSATGEVREEMKRVYRHIEAILETLAETGVEVKDHTGEAFDYGLPLNVVTTQPTPGIIKERVLETLKPTILWQGRTLQMGEVVIATPA